MKRIIALAAILSLGACAGAPQFKTQYALNQEGNLVERQVLVDSGGACDASGINWCVVGGITAGVLLGIWGLDRIYGDDDEPAPAQVVQPDVLATGGSQQSSWTTDYVQQTYVPIPSTATIQPY